MQHARALLESRPFLTRVPDQTVIVADRVTTSVPGTGRYALVATRDSAGSYAMVYAPAGRPFTVRLSAITGPKATAWWFNPRTGAATAAGTFATSANRTFTPPDPGEALDWVLVLDDASQRFGPPGARPARAGR
jgi:hypothetical protein